MSYWNSARQWYGQLRGYDRVSIAASVKAAANCRPQQIREKQLQAFREQVVRCAHRFPSYRTKLCEHLGTLPSSQDDFMPADIPLWTKQDQRRLFRSLKAADFRGCFLHSSGGSTGVPVQFYMTRSSYEWRVAVARRGYAYAQAEPGQPTFFVWSDVAVRPSLSTRLKQGLNQWADSRRFFNCFFFDDQRKRQCCAEINQYRPVTLVGYASKLVELASFCRQHSDLLKWRPTNIVTAAEGLQPGQRELLEEYLGDQVFTSYGSREFMLIGMESRHHCGYHLADDNLLVEVVDESGCPVAAGQMGQIVITDLHNAANPFIRYTIGDQGTLAPETEPCPNGFPFRLLLDVQGRNQEFVLTPEGDKLSLIYFAHNLKEFASIDAFQILQTSPQHLVVRLRSAQPLTTEFRRQVAAQLRPKLGSAYIEVEQVAELARHRNGKFAVLLSAADTHPSSESRPGH